MAASTPDSYWLKQVSASNPLGSYVVMAASTPDSYWLKQVSASNLLVTVTSNASTMRLE